MADEFADITRLDLDRRVLRLLGGAPRQTALANLISDTTTTVPVDNADDIQEDSVLEIDEEQVLVTNVTGTTLTVIRGYNSTDAVAHSDNDAVLIDPEFMKANRVEALNVVLNNWLSLYMPRLVWDTTTAGRFTPTRSIYAVDEHAISVQKVGYKIPGMVEIEKVAHGPLQSYPTSIVSTGRGVPVFGPVYYGSSVFVLAELPYTRLESDTDTLDTDFPAQADELIVQGAVLYLLGWRMVPKARLDETIFVREQGQSYPANVNIQWIEAMRQDWVTSAQRAANQRPIAAGPKKVFIA